MHDSTTINRISQLQTSDTWMRQEDGLDVDALAQAQADWHVEYAQLSDGHFAGSLHHIQLPGLRLVRESTNLAVRQRGSLGAGHYGLAVAMSHAQGAIFSGQKSSDSSIMLGRSEDLDLFTPVNFSLLGIVVERALLNALWTSFYQKPLPNWLQHQMVVDTDLIKIDALRAAHAGLMARIRTHPAVLHDRRSVLQMRDEILSEWLLAIPEKVDASNLKTLASRQLVVERACSAMLRYPDNPPTVLQICKVAGSSPRKLNYCFQEVLGTSPMKYFRSIRLNGVRRDLKANSQGHLTIADIASKWGFWHSGQFIALYKKHFNETPSVTHKNKPKP